MFEKGRKEGTVRFAIRPNGGVKKVELVGSFNDWKPLAMRKQKDGAYVSQVTVPGGTHEYKFIVDGQWIVDPDNSAWAVNPYGTLNSVARIED